MTSSVLDATPNLLDFPSVPSGTFLSSPVTRVVQEEPNTDDGGIIGSSRFCSFVYRVDQVGDGEVNRVWVPCKRWICRWCREQKIESESRRFTAGFQRDGRPVYWQLFDTREQATNAMRYATKLGHSALAIPDQDGRAVVVTTQPRKGAVPLHGADDLRETLETHLSQVPGHTKDVGENRVVNPNRILGGLLLSPDEFRKKEIRDRRSEYMDEARLALTERKEQARVRYYATPAFDEWIEKLGLVLTRSQYGHIMSYRIPDGGAEPMKAMLFWTEFDRLQQVEHCAA